MSETKLTNSFGKRAGLDWTSDSEETATIEAEDPSEIASPVFQALAGLKPREATWFDGRLLGNQTWTPVPLDSKCESPSRYDQYRLLFNSRCSDRLPQDQSITSLRRA